MANTLIMPYKFTHNVEICKDCNNTGKTDLLANGFYCTCEVGVTLKDIERDSLMFKIVDTEGRIYCSIDQDECICKDKSCNECGYYIDTYKLD